MCWRTNANHHFCLRPCSWPTRQVESETFLHRSECNVSSNSNWGKATTYFRVAVLIPFAFSPLLEFFLIPVRCVRVLCLCISLFSFLLHFFATQVHISPQHFDRACGVEPQNRCHNVADSLDYFPSLWSSNLVYRLPLACAFSEKMTNFVPFSFRNTSFAQSLCLLYVCA